MTPLDLLLIQSFTGGVNMPAGTTDALKLARANAAGTNIEYITAATAVTANDTLATALAPHLRGIGLTVDSSGNLKPRLRPRRLQEQDFFISGNVTSGSIGKLGWNLFGAGASVARVGVLLNSSSRFELITSNTTNSRAVLKLGESETRDTCVCTDINILQTMWNANNDLTTVRFFFGFMGDFSQEPSAATDCLGIYYDSAVSPNYQIIARAAGVGTPTVTGTAVPANNSRMLTIYQPTAGTMQFYVAGALVGMIASGLPTQPVDMGFRVETLANAVRKMRLGYFGVNADISDANTFAADAFLEV
jgi:hypothetical protein